MGTDHDQVGSDLQTRLRVRVTRWGFPAAGWVLYILSYGGMHASLGSQTVLAALVPVVATAWRGAVPGTLAGVAAVPLTALLDVARGESPWTSWSTAPALLGAIAIVIVGFAVGRTRDLQSRADTETAQRRRIEDDLREREVRLAVNSDIARAMRDGEPVDRIIQIVVDGLHTHFPHLRAAYSTVAEDGRITVACSVGAPELPSLGSTPLEPPAQAMETLAEVPAIGRE